VHKCTILQTQYYDYYHIPHIRNTFECRHGRMYWRLHSVSTTLTGEFVPPTSCSTSAHVVSRRSWLSTLNENIYTVNYVRTVATCT
jgi:hypothetical protein